MSNEIEKLKNANQYYLNMYGEIGKVTDWVVTTGIINEMRPQGNVFLLRKRSITRKSKTIFKTRNERI